MREIGADEFARDWKDKAGLNQSWRLQRRVSEEIGECQPSVGHWCHRGLDCIPCKIDPLQKVSNFIPANAESNLHHIWIRGFLVHGGVKTRAALFDVSEVERRYVRDHLDMIGVIEISVGNGNGGAVGDRECLREGGAKVGVG